MWFHYVNSQAWPCQQTWSQMLIPLWGIPCSWRQLCCISDWHNLRHFTIAVHCRCIATSNRSYWDGEQLLVKFWTKCSVPFSHSVMSNSLRPRESQYARPPCPSPTRGGHSNSCPSSQWCHPAIPSSVIPFSSCLQSLPAAGSFPMSQLFAWDGQSTGVSASVSVLLMNTQDWSPLGWTGWISLQSKGLSRVFSNTTVQKHQFFGTQLSPQSNSHIHTWPQEKP